MSNGCRIEWWEHAEPTQAETRTAKGRGDRAFSWNMWGVGGDVPTTLADLVMLRRAINEDWPVSSRVRQVIIDELTAEIDTPDVRRSLSVARSFLAMGSANIRAEKNWVAG